MKTALKKVTTVAAWVLLLGMLRKIHAEGPVQIASSQLSEAAASETLESPITDFADADETVCDKQAEDKTNLRGGINKDLSLESYSLNNDFQITQKSPGHSGGHW